MDLASFVEEKFLAPMCNYYTAEATAVYALALIGAVYLIFRFLKRFEIPVDSRMFFASIPFIIYGGMTRALRDHGIYQGPLFCSPPIYFFVFFLAALSLVAGVLVQRKTGMGYHHFMFAIGTSLVVLDLSLISIQNWSAVASVFFLTLFWFGVLQLASALVPEFFTRTNRGIILSHLFDASSTFTALSFFGYCEQHVIPGILTGKYCAAASLPSFLVLPFMPWMMFVVKLAAVIPALLVIDRYVEDRPFANFLKLVILVLGLALGTRDFLTVAMKPI